MPSMPASTPDGTRYRGLLYRSLNPIYARQPLSGRGAALFGGRFNRKGVEALYTSLSADGAIREANQVGDLQPTTLVAYRADIEPLFDAGDTEALASWSMSPADLADPDWRERLYRGEPAPTQAFAGRLVEAGFAGMLVPSYARGATPEHINLVLWHWNTGPHDRLVLIDHEGRLSQHAT